MSTNSPLFLVVDSGSSLLKCLYRFGRKKTPQYLISSSNCRKAITGEVGVNLQFEGQSWQVGENAPDNQYEYIQKLKAESIVPKILHIIGTIAIEKQLEVINIHLTILLPWGEISDSKFVLEELANLEGKKIEFNGFEFQLDFKTKPIIYPEGSGICNLFEPKQVNGSCGVLMAGYRNVSYIHYNRGILNPQLSKSTYLGFYRVLETIISNSSGLSKSQILTGISTKAVRQPVNMGKVETVGFKSTITPEKIVTAENPKLRKDKIQELEKAIEIAIQVYSRDVVNWLKQILPLNTSKPQILALSGGSINFFETEITKAIDTPTISSVPLGISIMETLNLSQDKQQDFIASHLPIRLADAWGCFRQL